MNLLRYLILPLLFILAVAATYAVATYLLENETERILRERIATFEKACPNPGDFGAPDDYPEISTSFGMRVLVKLMQSGEPGVRFWSARIAEDNGMKKEFIQTMIDLLEERKDKTNSERAYVRLAIYAYHKEPIMPYSKAKDEDIRKLIEQAASKAGIAKK